jgi:hypothetical protein
MIRTRNKQRKSFAGPSVGVSSLRILISTTECCEVQPASTEAQPSDLPLDKRPKDREKAIMANQTYFIFLHRIRILEQR